MSSKTAAPCAAHRQTCRRAVGGLARARRASARAASDPRRLWCQAVRLGQVPRLGGRRLAARRRGADPRGAGDGRRRGRDRSGARRWRRATRSRVDGERPVRRRRARRLRAQQAARRRLDGAAIPQRRPTVVSLVPAALRLYPGRPARHRHDRPDPADQRRRARPPPDASKLRGREDLSVPSSRARRCASARCARCARASSSTTASTAPARVRRLAARRARDHDPRGPQAPGAADVRGGRASGAERSSGFASGRSSSGDCARASSRRLSAGEVERAQAGGWSEELVVAQRRRRERAGDEPRRRAHRSCRRAAGAPRTGRRGPPGRRRGSRGSVASAAAAEGIRLHAAPHQHAVCCGELIATRRARRRPRRAGSMSTGGRAGRATAGAACGSAGPGSLGRRRRPRAAGSDRPGHAAPIGPLEVAVDRHADRRDEPDRAQRCRAAEAEHAGRGAAPSPIGHEQRERQPQDDHVARDQVVDSAGDQHELERDPGERPGRPRAAARRSLSVGAPEQQRDPEQHRCDAEREQHASVRAPRYRQELRGDLAAAAGRAGSGRSSSRGRSRSG